MPQSPPSVLIIHRFTFFFSKWKGNTQKLRIAKSVFAYLIILISFFCVALRVTVYQWSWSNIWPRTVQIAVLWKHLINCHIERYDTGLILAHAHTHTMYVMIRLNGREWPSQPGKPIKPLLDFSYWRLQHIQALSDYDRVRGRERERDEEIAWGHKINFP